MFDKKMKKWYRALYICLLEHMKGRSHPLSVCADPHKLYEHRYHIQCVISRAQTDFSKFVTRCRMTALLAFRRLFIPKDLRLMLGRLLCYKVVNVQPFLKSLLPYVMDTGLTYNKFDKAKCPYCVPFSRKQQCKDTNMKACCYCNVSMCIRDLKWHKCTNKQMPMGYWSIWEDIQEIE